MLARLNGCPMSAAIAPNDSPPPSKTSRLGFFGFGKKHNKVELNAAEAADSVPASSSAHPIDISLRSKAHPSKSPVRSLQPGSPDRPTSASYGSQSPPRLASSSSQIFERNVQEQPNGSLAAPRPNAVERAPRLTLKRPVPWVRSLTITGNSAPKMPAPMPSSICTATSQ